jgi:membrane associated rhomboid family serine protease
MPFVCKFCKGRYCAAHRLPENHGCAGLGEYRERVRAEGRLVRPEPDVVAPRYSTTARASMNMNALWSRVDGKMTMVLIGVTVAVYVLQWAVAVSTSGATHNSIFAISWGFWMRPWTLVTNVFSHSLADIWHIVFNMLILLFFGRTVEQLIGTRRFTYLYLGAGIAAGIAQATITHFLYQLDVPALGASGALLGITGLLVVLAPRMTVLVFGILPAPMWALGGFYVLMDVFGAFNPGSGVGHFAHLAGFAIGAAYAYSLKQKGLRVYTRPPREPTAPWR